MTHLSIRDALLVLRLSLHSRSRLAYLHREQTLEAIAYLEAAQAGAA